MLWTGVHLLSALSMAGEEVGPAGLVLSERPGADGGVVLPVVQLAQDSRRHRHERMHLAEVRIATAADICATGSENTHEQEQDVDDDKGEKGEWKHVLRDDRREPAPERGVGGAQPESQRLLCLPTSDSAI
jgi:hypothetical protein